MGGVCWSLGATKMYNIWKELRLYFYIVWQRNDLMRWSVTQFDTSRICLIVTQRHFLWIISIPVNFVGLQGTILPLTFTLLLLFLCLPLQFIIFYYRTFTLPFALSRCHSLIDIFFHYDLDLYYIRARHFLPRTFVSKWNLSTRFQWKWVWTTSDSYCTSRHRVGLVCNKWEFYRV